MFIRCQNVQNRQLVIFSFLPQKRIQDLDVRNLRLIDQDRIQKMDRHTRMLRTPEHHLEREIYCRTDAYCHETVTSRCSTKAVGSRQQNRRLNRKFFVLDALLKTHVQTQVLCAWCLVN